MTITAADLPAQLLPSGAIEYVASKKALLTRTREQTWIPLPDLAQGDMIPVHAFGRHYCEYYVKRSDLDGRREKIRLWERCAE